MVTKKITSQVSPPANKAVRRSSTAKPAASTSPRVGEMLQKLRLERGLTLEDVSRTAGVSKSMVSDIEREKANPTIAVAWRLANALGIGLDKLFSETDTSPQQIELIQPHNLPSLLNQSEGYQLKICGPMSLAGRFEWYELSMDKGGKLASSGHDPGTQEHLTVYQGRVKVQVAGQSMVVGPGELARYPADQRHELINQGESSVKALLVVVHGD